MTDKCKSFFIIERLDMDKKSENLKKIYDLSSLDKIYEVKPNDESKIQVNNENNSNENEKEKEKEKIIKVVKKAALSVNFAFKWKLESFKTALILMEILTFYLSFNSSFNIQTSDSFISIFFNYIYPSNKNDYNISYGLNETINNLTNDTETNLFDINDYNSTNTTNGINKSFNIKFFITTFIVNHIALIPFWLIIIYIFNPSWEQMNDALYKITKYLLQCESLNQENYFFHLMENYSIFVLKKEFFSNYKKIPIKTKIEKSLPLNLCVNDNIINKNMFSYCISIINDFVVCDFIDLNYNKLISNEDSAVINILIKYIDHIVGDGMVKYIKGIFIPITLIVYVSMYHFKSLNLYFSPSTLLILLNLLILTCIYKENYGTYKEKIDIFIDKFNSLLIQKNRFIYRKDQLILFFVLKNNHYTKDEIINTIKKIMA
jgi:hypothetical protein